MEIVVVCTLHYQLTFGRCCVFIDKRNSLVESCIVWEQYTVFVMPTYTLY